jgi:hypothetical protein
VLFTILAVFYIPFFIWLSLTYVGYNKAGAADSKRKGIYLGFLILFNLYNLVSNSLFHIDASIGLPISISIILIFSIYMLWVISKDKKMLVMGEKV